MLCSLVVAVVGANLKAIAQRGSCATAPSALWQRIRVDLHHGAVDVVIQLGPPLLPAAASGGHGVDIGCGLDVAD